MNKVQLKGIVRKDYLLRKGRPLCLHLFFNTHWSQDKELGSDGTWEGLIRTTVQTQDQEPSDKPSALWCQIDKGLSERH